MTRTCELLRQGDNCPLGPVPCWGFRLPPHEIVPNAKDHDLLGDLKTKSTIEAHILGSIGLEVASFAGSIEFFAALLHESMTDMLTLRLW